MALHRMGLGAEFTLNVGPAVKSANAARASIGRLKTGLTQLGLASAPVAAAFALGANEAARYEKQVSAVRAVSGATREEMARASKQFKMLALDTKFSHIEAAEGAEVLTRAGFNQTEMLTALRPVMDAAAADNLDLATAADVVASSIRAMGLEATDAAMVADTLAQASASSNTNIRLLGESFRYAAAQAKTAGISYKTTTAVLGALGDSGLKGSIAGTSFTNMLIKMAKPSEKAEKLMGKYGGKMINFKDGTLDVISTMKTFGPAMDKIPTAMKKAAFLSEVFGIRGQKAVNALVTAIEKGRFEKLHKKLEESEGAAGRMAAIQLDNTIGQFTKLRKAIGVFWTELLGPVLDGAFKGMFKSLHKGLATVLKAAIELRDATSPENAERIKRKYGVYAEIALGIIDAANSIRHYVNKTADAFKSLGKWIGKTLGKDGVRNLTKYVILFGALLAALFPLGIAITGLSMAFGGLGTLMRGLGVEAVITKLAKLTKQLLFARAAAAGTTGSGASAAGIKKTTKKKPGVSGIAPVKGSKLVQKGGKFVPAGSLGALGALSVKMKAVGKVAGRVFGFIWRIMTGVSGVIAKLLLPALAAFMIIIALIRKKGETTGGTLSRVWNSILIGVGKITSALSQLWYGLSTGLIPIVEQLGIVWEATISSVQMALVPFINMISWWFDESKKGTQEAATDWVNVGRTIAAVIGAILHAFIKVAGGIARGIAYVVNTVGFLGKALGEGFGWWIKNIGTVWDNFILSIQRGAAHVLWLSADLLNALGFEERGAKMAGAAAGFLRDNQYQGYEDPGIGEEESPIEKLKLQLAKIDDREKASLDKLATSMDKLVASQAKATSAAEETAKNSGKDKKTDICIDGRKVASATSKHSQIDHERGGGGHDAWQRRRAFIQQ